VAGSIIGLYYYLRIIVAMTAAAVADPDSQAPDATRAARSCRACGPGLAADRPGRVPGAASEPHPCECFDGDALTDEGLQIFHGLR
jgi:hypothetical protein